MKKKNDGRRDRAKETINTEGLTSWRAADSKTGVSRCIFPQFRVDREDLEIINDHCQKTDVERSVLMRQLVKEFCQSLNSD